MMKFCVLAKISKSSVSFWYQSDNNAYAPLSIKDSNEIPLYFYVNENNFLFGSTARDLFNRHDPDAYGNYFEIIKDPSKHFSIYGNKKPVKQLFYYGIEQYLSYFLNTILFKVDSIESYRQQFPLRFLFETDIEDNERSLIEHLFQEAGYFNLDRINYNKSLLGVLAIKELYSKDKAILLLSGIDDVLYLQLYSNVNAELRGSSRLEKQGADPRVKILADMIVDYVVTQNPYLSIDKEREIANLLGFCAGLLEDFKPMITGDAELSDGNKYWFNIRTNNLITRLQYHSNDTIVYTAIDDLLKASNLSVENVIILLGTEEVSTEYFKNTFLKRYSFVDMVTSADAKATMDVIFQDIANLNSQINTIPDLPQPVKVQSFPTPPKGRPVLPPVKEKFSQAPIATPQLPGLKKTSGAKVNVKIPPLPSRKHN